MTTLDREVKQGWLKNARRARYPVWSLIITHRCPGGHTEHSQNADADAPCLRRLGILKSGQTTYILRWHSLPCYPLSSRSLARSLSLSLSLSLPLSFSFPLSHSIFLYPAMCSITITVLLNRSWELM